MSSSNAVGQLFQQGRIADAIEAASAAVRQDQADVARRILLAELLLFSDDWARADVVLDAASAADPAAAVMIAEFRQVLRAAQARRHLATDGRVPEFIGEPTRSQTCLLRGLAAMRAGDAKAAAKASEEAEDARPRVSGVGNDLAFDDFRDLDDLIGGTLEVLTPTGRYFWIPIERIESLSLHKPRRPRDLCWRRCSIVVRNGSEGEVCLPAIYDGMKPVNEALCLGRSTAWTPTAPVRGSGQRIFLAGEETRPIHELSSVRFDA